MTGFYKDDDDMVSAVAHVWDRDLVLESRLKAIGAKFQYRQNVNIKSILVAQSKKNNARFNDPIDEDLCLKYASHMEEGYTFPAIVMSPKGFVWDGNNRLHAAQIAGIEEVSAYVIINADKDMQDMFCRTANARHGKGNSEDEALQHIVHLHFNQKVDGKPTPVSQLYKIYFPPTQRYYDKACNAVRVRKVELELFKLNVDATELGQSILAKLYTYHPESGVKNTKLLKAAANLIIKHRLTIDAVDDMVRLVKTKKSEKDQIAAMQEFAKDQGVAPKPRKSNTRDGVRLERYFDSIIKLIGNKQSLQKLGVNAPADIQRIKSKITQVSKQVNTLKKNS